jgi:thioredoxin 1
MMMPILAELKSQYADRLSVEFYDVREDQGAVQRYRISVIPTQIFYDASGNERFRHEGFFSKEDIPAKWKELGVDLSSGAPPVLADKMNLSPEQIQKACKIGECSPE